MNNRLTIIIALVALLIFGGAQCYVVNELYRLKNREFIQNAQDEIIFALSNAQQQSGSGLFREISEILDKTASDLIFTIPEYQLGEDSVRSLVFQQFKTLIHENENITSYLKTYLYENGKDSLIESFFIIHNLKLKNFTLEYPVFSDVSDSSTGFNQDRLKKGSAYIYTFDERYNYFDIEFSYYIDFSNRIRYILTELGSVLSILAVMLIMVLMVYILTLRNMVKQGKLSTLKSEFISNMTHELKTPLSTIAVASASLGLDKIAGDEKRSKELSDIINRQNKLLNQMIDQVLDVSALERNGFSVLPETVEIIPFLQQIVQDFSINKSDTGLKIEEDFSINERATLNIDPFQMTRVINNLLSNAVKYSEEIPRLKLELSQTGEKIKISLTDNGSGISREDQKHVFSKFYRGNHDLNKKVKGLGLGLYFVKKIVEAHHGTVSLKSNKGTGSTFIIELPAKS